MSFLLSPASAIAPAAHSACSCATVLSGALRVGCSNAPTMQALAWRWVTADFSWLLYCMPVLQSWSEQSRGRVCGGAHDAAASASLRLPCGARVAKAAAELALAWPARCCAARLCSELEQSSPTRRLTATRNLRNPALLGAA